MIRLGSAMLILVSIWHKISRTHFLLKIGPVVSAENRLTDGNCVACSRRGRRILSNIDDKYVLYFLIFQWTLTCQANNVVVMKAN